MKPAASKNNPYQASKCTIKFSVFTRGIATSIFSWFRKNRNATLLLREERDFEKRKTLLYLAGNVLVDRALV
jgi:hypothetical protein